MTISPAFAVITVSDRAARGEYPDRSGPLAQEMLRELGEVVSYDVVPDGVDSVQQAVYQAIDAGANVVITSGGTGITTRDQTPQALEGIIKYEIPGIPALIREKSKVITAALTRCIAGVVEHNDKRAMAICLPGSPSGVAEAIDIMSPLLDHIADQLNDGDHVRGHAHGHKHHGHAHKHHDHDHRHGHKHAGHKHDDHAHTHATYELQNLRTSTECTATEVMIARVSEDPIDMDELNEAVRMDVAGAEVSFCGRVRNHDQQRGVESIYYVAHPSAADALTHIVDSVARESGCHRIAVAHRFGTLNVGDVALGIAVSSSHRQEAYATMMELTERIKMELPLWKKQEFTDGSSAWSGML
ncbi:MAG: molybdopterin converting factor [Actinomycetaceae bacterium]|nr:molybdopterin converting factor [Actinomycetaceae bacterium]